MTTTNDRATQKACHIETDRRYVDAQPYDTDQFLIGANSSGLTTLMCITTAEAEALATWLLERIAATRDCEVCAGTGGVLDPNHDDQPIACPECRTHVHEREYDRRESVSVPA